MSLTVIVIFFLLSPFFIIDIDMNRLNEGMTVYTERKIYGRMAGEAMRHFKVDRYIYIS